MVRNETFIGKTATISSLPGIGVHSQKLVVTETGVNLALDDGTVRFTWALELLGRVVSHFESVGHEVEWA